MSRSVTGYLNGHPQWSPNVPASPAPVSGFGARQPGEFIASYKVGPAPEVRHEAALRAAETVRRNRPAGLRGAALVARKRR